MKPGLLFFVLLILCSCGQTSGRTTTKQGVVLAGSAKKAETSGANDKANNHHMEPVLSEWERQEDSLRNVLLRKKEQILKESFLQEMYSRNAVTVSGDSLFVTIPFNVHGPDCGAPDCYSTDIRFAFPFDGPLRFPKNMRFREHEHGCVDREKELSGNFQLMEQTGKHVIYHSGKHKRTLVLFRSKKETGTIAWYFTGVGQHSINGQNVYTLMRDYNEEDKQAIYPFTSRLLTTNE